MATTKKDEKKTMSSKDKVTLQPLKKEAKPKAEAPVDEAEDTIDDNLEDQLSPVDAETQAELKKQKEAEDEQKKLDELVSTKKYFLPIKERR